MYRTYPFLFASHTLAASKIKTGIAAELSHLSINEKKLKTRFR